RGPGCPLHSIQPAPHLAPEEGKRHISPALWPGTGLRLSSSPLISLQRQNGPGQRVIREVNTTTRACALWGLAEDSDYTVQVRSIGLRGESPPGPRVHFRTLKGSDRLPSNSSGPGDSTVEGLDGERPLQTGEVVITVVVLLMWAAVIGLFCRQYDIIKDNDSNNNPKEKGKGPEQSPQGRPVGTRQHPSVNSSL
uniref:Fibronectin type III domain containing 4 n=1 Tax=Saimiri boliviensis boliviensis TaxID=39432 RepID=A0A2K6UUG1_SAIBB